MTAALHAPMIYAALNAHRGAPRFWRDDCARAVLGVYRGLGCRAFPDLEAVTARDMAARMRAAGSLVEAVRLHLEPLGWRRVSIAGPLDLGAFEGGDGVLGICITAGGAAGPGFMTRGPRGAVLVREPVAVWRMPEGALDGS